MDDNHFRKKDEYPVNMYSPVTVLPNAKAISDKARESSEIEKIKRDNTKLTGEVSILRSNILLLEKDNYKLRTEKSKILVNELTKLEEVRKEMKLLKTENRIKENQLRAFKKVKSADNNLAIDTKWALEMIEPKYILSLHPFEYERLKKLHDFFYEDFKMMLCKEEVIEEMKKIKNKFAQFLDFFLVFCCKRDIFEYFLVDLFCKYGFEENSKYSKKMFKILKYLPIEWISSFFTNETFIKALNEFLETNLENKDIIIFYLRVIEDRPFLLSLVLNIKLFTLILYRKDEYSEALLEKMAEKGFSSFIDHKNIHLIKERHLKKFFSEKYTFTGYDFSGEKF